MPGRTVVALSVTLLLSAPALAMDCPPEVSSLEDREQAVRKAATCKKSLEMMQACAYGASGDVSLGAVVTETCEAGFLGKLSKAQRRSYDREQRRCDDKYRNESGTMYRSFSAFCRAENAVRTAAKFASAKAKAKSSAAVRPAQRPAPAAQSWPSRRSPGTPPARRWRGRTAPCGPPARRPWQARR